MAKLNEYLTMIDGYLSSLRAVLRGIKSQEELSQRPTEYYATPAELMVGLCPVFIKRWRSDEEKVE